MLKVSDKNEKRARSRSRRWLRFRFLRVWSGLNGATRICQRAEGEVRITRDGGGIAHVSGVMRCGSPWACPVCAPTVREHRASDLDGLLSAHLAAGGGAEFVTVTMPHGYGQRLRPMLETVRKGWTSVVGCPAWAGRKDAGGVVDPGLKRLLGVLGQVKAVEMTYGANGWHPHVHVLVVTARPLDDGQRLRLREHVYERWARYVVRQGYGRPSWDHGCDVRPVTAKESDGGSSMAGYLSKVADGWGAGLELARSDCKVGKTSLTPWQILDEAIDQGDGEKLDLWREYEAATKGVRALVWSPGLRSILGASAGELSDEEAAVQVGDGEVTGEVVLAASVWHGLVDAGDVPTLLDVLEEEGGEAAERWVVKWLARFLR